MTDLFAWAAPATVGGSLVDHTWVTSYDNRIQNYPTINAVIAANENYWFCWGIYRPKGHAPGNPTGFLGSQAGSLGLARCLVEENVSSAASPPARGTIFTYGVDGVCHQLSNQVLYATVVSGTPLTVKRARGYAASVFLYGTYGRQRAAWQNKILGCTAPSTPPPPTTAMDDMPDDFEEQARMVLSDDPEVLARLLRLRAEVQQYLTQELPGGIRPNAEFLNARNQVLLEQAAKLLGASRFEQLFGFPPSENVVLVDPTIVRAQEENDEGSGSPEPAPR